MLEDDFNHPGRANEFFLWGLFQAHQVMEELVKEYFTKHPKFHIQMVMLILETMVPQVELEVVSVACANVSALPVTSQN